MKKCLLVLIAGLLLYAMAAYGTPKADTPIGPGILYTKPVKSVLFTHKSHGAEQGLSCIRCHNGLFEMEALKVQERKDFNMESFYRGKYCGACHNGKDAFAADTQCARCHIRVKGAEPRREVPSYKVSQPFARSQTPVSFSHDKHEKSAKCSQCHPGLFKIKTGANKITYADHSRKTSCFVCHDGKTSFSWNTCNRCHIRTPMPGDAIALGKGDKVTMFSHQVHMAKYSCGSCHPSLFPSKRGVVKITAADHNSQKACFFCHAGTAGKTFYDCSRCHRE